MPDGFDVAVVGGGAAGCVVARRLAERGDRRVVLIEAGPDLRDETPTDWRDGWRLPTLPDWNFRSEPDADGASGPLRRGRLLGGTSWLTRFAVRGPAADYDAWAAAGNPGWAYADVLPALRELETDAEFGATEHHGAAGPIPITRYPRLEPSPIHAAGLAALVDAGFPLVLDHNAPDAAGVGRMPMSSRAGARVTTVDAYLPPEAPPASLTVRADAVVAAVEVERGRAVGVRLADGTRIAAGRIVLAAGTYGSPTILLCSGIGPADDLRRLGIGTRVDLPGVGANLADHPGVEVDTGWSGAAVNGPILHSIATFRSAGRAVEQAPDLMFWIADPAGGEPTFTFEVVLLKPTARGSVRLRSTDPGDPPRISLPRLGDGPDMDRLIEAVELARAIAGEPVVRRLAAGTPPATPATRLVAEQFVRENGYSIPHVVGTCAMGPRPEDGAVVDSSGHVHGVDRLSVVDASIIPDAPAGFPHLITIMLAERLSARLADSD